MRLQRLKVEQVRQFRQALEIADFAPGINIFAGPNESGKSTLVRAIRAAFFERYRSNSVSDLQPRDDSSAAPQVALDFVHDNQSWQLVKRFLKRHRCDLSIDGQALSGDEAEERLAGLLGFQFAGKGGSKAEHWGIPGLLWIEQGQGQEIRAAVQHAGEHLQSALGASLGEVASSGGDDIIRAVEDIRAAYLTKTGKVTGEYRDAEDKCASLAATLQDLDDRIDIYRARVDRLGELRAQQARDEAERPWEGLRQQQQQARQQLDEATRLSEQQAADSKALAACQDNIRLLGDQLAEMQKQGEELLERERTHSRLREQLAQLETATSQITAVLRQANEHYQAARDLEREARQAAERRLLARQHQQLEAQRTKLAASLQEAREVKTALAACHREQAACRIDSKDLARLKRLAGELNELRIRRQSIATRVEYALEPDRTLMLEGSPLEGAGEQLLLEPALLEITGIGQLRIVPGGEDVGDLARRLEQAEERYTALLQNMQVESLAAAEQRAERERALQSSVDTHQRLLLSHAPGGIEALEVDMAGVDEQIGALQARLAAMPATPGEAPEPEQAEAQVAMAQAALKTAEETEQAHLRQLATVRQQVDSAGEEYQRLHTAVVDPQRENRRQENARRRDEQRTEAETLVERIEQRKAAIAAARADILEQDIKRFGESASQAEAAFRTRREALAALEAELGALGGGGLEEERGGCLAELDSWNRRHAELQRRAEGADLLLSLLREKRQQLTRRLQAPLQRHLDHYLQLLFPRARLDVDDNLMPGQLVRVGPHGQEAGDFDTLSFGAREQMGLISRLAYADLLKAAGRPTLIILDDALVHSDVQRLEQMKRILFDAGQRHQLLLFTCHPDKWTDLGVPVRELASFLQESA